MNLVCSQLSVCTLGPAGVTAWHSGGLVRPLRRQVSAAAGSSARAACATLLFRTRCVSGVGLASAALCRLSDSLVTTRSLWRGAFPAGRPGLADPCLAGSVPQLPRCRSSRRPAASLWSLLPSAQ